MRLPEFDGRGALLTVTHVVVVFSILVQGLTLGRMIRWLYSPASQLAPVDAEPARSEARRAS